MLGFLGGLASVVGNIFSGERGNKARRKEAQRDRNFQERMSSTSWQRSVADMEAAGINPALAYQQGGASSPSGAMAQQSDVGQDSVSSALGVKMQQEQLTLVQAERTKALAEANIAQSEQSTRRYELDKMNVERSLYFNRDGSPKAALQQLIREGHGARLANSARSVSDAEGMRLGLSERRAVSQFMDQAGSGGAGIQRLLPLLIALANRRQ